MEMLSPTSRVWGAVVALAVTYSFAANRVLRAIEFKVWSQTP